MADPPWRTAVRGTRDLAVAYLRYGILGTSVNIDASTVCQLRCSVCPQSQDQMGFLGRGFLSFENFKRFVDAHRAIRTIELSNYGEIFLNPHLAAITRYARERGVSLTAWNGVNLNTVSEEMLETLVRFGFQGMTVSIDGASPETYGLYRRGGDFRRVIDNLERLNYFKKRYRSETPHLHWQFVVFGHNEHEIPAARRMAGELGMHFIPKTNWDSSFSPLRHRDYVARETGLGAGEGAGSGDVRARLRQASGPCSLVWFSPQINWDGRLLGCCVNLWKDFGNVFDRGLARCVEDPGYRHLKRALLGRADAPGDIPCIACPRYSVLSKIPPAERMGLVGVRGRRPLPPEIIERIAFSKGLLQRMRRLVRLSHPPPAAG